MFCYQKRCKVNTIFLIDKIFLAKFLNYPKFYPIFNILRRFSLSSFSMLLWLYGPMVKRVTLIFYGDSAAEHFV